MSRPGGGVGPMAKSLLPPDRTKQPEPEVAGILGVAVTLRQRIEDLEARIAVLENAVSLLGTPQPDARTVTSTGQTRGRHMAELWHECPGFSYSDLRDMAP